jgi:hypothetical protein
MGWPQFLAWAATQGFKNIKFLRQAFNSFKGKFPGKEVVLKTAKNLWDDVIKKTSTKDLTKQIRQDIKKDRPFPGAGTLKVVPKTKQIVEKLKTVKPGEKVIVPIGSKKPPFILTKTPKPKGPAEIIQFPKKPPGKADGGRIDKALPTRSRDI